MEWIIAAILEFLFLSSRSTITTKVFHFMSTSIVCTRPALFSLPCPAHRGMFLDVCFSCPRGRPGSIHQLTVRVETNQIQNSVHIHVDAARCHRRRLLAARQGRLPFRIVDTELRLTLFTDPRGTLIGCLLEGQVEPCLLLRFILRCTNKCPFLLLLITQLRS